MKVLRWETPESARHSADVKNRLLIETSASPVTFFSPSLGVFPSAGVAAHSIRLLQRFGEAGETSDVAHVLSVKSTQLGMQMRAVEGAGGLVFLLSSEAVKHSTFWCSTHITRGQ